MCSPLCIYSVLVYIEVLQGPPATLQVHPNPHCLLLQLLGFCCCCCCCCCEVQMQAHLMLPPTPPEMQLTCGMPLSPGGACTPNGASTLGLPTGLLTGAGRDAKLAVMAASLAATACCTSGLRRMMSSRAGPSSCVRFRLVQPRSNSDA